MAVRRLEARWLLDIHGYSLLEAPLGWWVLVPHGRPAPTGRTRLTVRSGSRMQPAVRKALTNLQGIYDEGFMSQQEYEKRRKAM